MQQPTKSLRSGMRLGKYRLESKLGDGGFSNVYRAYDTIEGVRVALKIPYATSWTAATLEDFQREVRVAARLDHPHILPVKNADFIDGWFVIAFPLAERSLADRLQKRLRVATALDFGEQALSAVAFAHEQKVIHCDIKPENFLLFADNHLMLTDFGLARIAMQTLHASGSGTVGYVAPEQAMGKPSARSDVFSLGLVLYRMLTGHLPEWPYEWPFPGMVRLKPLPKELTSLLRRAISVDARHRFRDAAQMLNSFQRVKAKALRQPKARQADVKQTGNNSTNWKTIRKKQFQRRFGRMLATQHACQRCDGPVAESMMFCPWCAEQRDQHVGDTSFPQCCPRCFRGMKLDWEYCAWCFGPGFEASSREYRDQRYTARCSNPGCERKLLMPWMRYCPWCRRKVRQRWKIENHRETCRHCSWGVVREFWEICPWCGKPLE